MIIFTGSFILVFCLVRKPVFSTHLNTIHPMHPVRLNTVCKSNNFLEGSSLKSQGVLRSGGGGGFGPHIKFGGKIWGKVLPSSPNKRKNLESSVITRRKSWEKNPNFGVKSEI